MSLTEPTDDKGHRPQASDFSGDLPGTVDDAADAEARLVLSEFLPNDQVVRKRVFSSLLRGLTRGTS